VTRLWTGIGTLLIAVIGAQAPDADLATYINSIPAIDNHAYVIAPDAEHDTGYDALPCDALPPGTSLPPANLRFNPGVLAAWKALYGFTGTGGEAAQVTAARRAQDVLRQQQGARYFEHILDLAHIHTALANRITMAAALKSPRFLWVPYADALLFPLDNTGVKAASPDRNVFVELEERHLETMVKAAGLTGLPPSFDAYLDLVLRTLRGQRSAGAVAIKFEVAYLRSLDFAPATREAAGAVYRRYRAGGVPDPAQYRALQDFLFRFIAAQAGKLKMAVQIHTGNGCGDYFDVRGAAPVLLVSVLNDPALRATSFVLLHGGSPEERSLATLIAKPNVYVDTSFLEFAWSPAEMARVLRPWLEVMPEHVLFGTDAGPFGPGVGWEESTWLGSDRARQALTLALDQMVVENAISAPRAREIASAVLRDNAVTLYRLEH
jgi:predicted TIM-barrel fold metal-dependent hydrolase